MSQSIHRYIRSLTRHYPSRFLAPQFSRLMEHLFPTREPLWLVSEPCGQAPFWALNLAHSHQRKIYYFPKAWGAYWMAESFPSFLDKHVVPGSLFMDIGAHLGSFSFYAARLIGPEGQSILFEPDPDIYEALARSAKLNYPDTIICENIALSNENGTATFYKARRPASSSLMPESEAEGHAQRYESSVEVARLRLDDYVEEHEVDLDRLKLIKCDVEGHEIETVSGMRQTLVDAGYPLLWQEVRGPSGSTRAPNTYPEVKRLLGELGYKPFFWTDGVLRPVLDKEVVGREDVVFRHEDGNKEGG